MDQLVLHRRWVQLVDRQDHVTEGDGAETPAEPAATNRFAVNG